MTEITEEEIADRELRNAAYHEAGHKVLYVHFGGAGDAVVWRNDSGNQEERAWRGQFRPRICPEHMRIAAINGGLPARQLPENWRALVGMAGLLAEEIANGLADAYVLTDDLASRIEAGEASGSDLAMTNITDTDNCQLSVEAVDGAAQLLLALWGGVEQESERLIELAESEPTFT